MELAGRLAIHPANWLVVFIKMHFSFAELYDLTKLEAKYAKSTSKPSCKPSLMLNEIEQLLFAIYLQILHVATMLEKQHKIMLKRVVYTINYLQDNYFSGSISCRNYSFLIII